MRPRFSTMLALAAMAVLGLSLALFMSARTALADTNGCPSGGSRPTSNLVGASYTTSGNSATYYFDSFVDQSPVDGVPGLIEYCVYPDPATQPDNVTVVAVGADNSAWTDPPSFDNFSFQRTSGNPSNIPLDGRMNYEMGTATWSGGVPASQVIVLHINDEAECNRLGQSSQTCFVLPGSPQTRDAEPPTVSKDAHGSFDKTFTWTITKSVDKTVVKQVGGTATFNYTITVSHDSGTNSNVKVSGTITVNNPNSAGIAIDGVTDQLSNGTVCSVTGGGAQNLPAGDTTFAYSCSLSSVPTGDLFNTATVSWSEQTLSDDSHLAAGSADYTTGAISFAENDIDECVSVSDSYAGTLGTVCVGDANSTFTYSRTIPVPQFDCLSYDNTATFTTNDTGATGSDSQTVRVCGPAKTGALTMGFWQNKNGQNIIGSYSGTNCQALKTWLAQFNPFNEAALTGATNCTAVKNYVTNVIKAANSSGTTMNPMLKAQMLATALDVYFSDPALGGNRIGAPAPIGGVSIDLTLICKMIDGSSTATCNGTYQNVSSAFGGATSMTVMNMLLFQNTVSNNGGTIWYGQVKATQELAKNAFDAINNQVAFSA